MLSVVLASSESGLFGSLAEEVSPYKDYPGQTVAETGVSRSFRNSFIGCGVLHGAQTIQQEGSSSDKIFRRRIYDLRSSMG